MADIKRDIIHIDEELCNGCGNCVSSCAKGAIQIIDGKAKLISEHYCDGLGRCLNHCPMGALKIIQKNITVPSKGKPTNKACPSNQLSAMKNGGILNNWPIQLALVPPNASYFENADLLTAADCTAFATADPKFIQNKVLLICCPKLDDTMPYVNKLVEIFKQHTIQSITITRMSVPCCAKLTHIVTSAVKLSEKHITIDEKIIEIN
jgi:Pyruvate/2-oxoacid:ferredoxin oxidoreductase delta subunit